MIRYRLELGPGDLRSIPALALATGFFSEAEIEVVRELVEENLAKGPEASGYCFTLAEEGGELAGFACHGPVPMTQGSFDLYWIAVHPAHMRRGLGSLLLDQVEEQARAAGARLLYAETSDREQYHPTREFYLATGFAQAARLPDFYAPGEGKVIYCKML